MAIYWLRDVLAMQTNAAPQPPIALVVLSAALAGLSAWAIWRYRRLAADIRQAEQDKHNLEAELKERASKNKDEHKRLDEAREELKELKQELAATKKKHHAAQEEAKRLREELREQAKERDRLLADKPAFEPPQPRVKLPVAPKVAPPVAALPREDSKAKQELDKALSERQELAAALLQEQKERKAERRAIQEQQRYAEQLKRISAVAKGKVELLEDKLAHLGRQYYEVVSELAARKGEVVPPGAKRLVPTPEADALGAELESAAAQVENETAPRA